MFEAIWNFVVEYYFTGGYNIVNTLTYGLVLGFFVFKLIPRLKPLLGNIDLSFFVTFTPFILFGSTLRELIDQELGVYVGHTSYPANWFFVSPGIYFSMFSITFTCMVVGFAAQKFLGWSWRKVCFTLGMILFAYNLALIIPNITGLGGFTLVVTFFLLSSAVLFGITKLPKLGFLGFEANYAIVLVHFFDASTTFVGIDFLGHVEKHVVPTFFIDLVGTAAVMYPLKLLVLLPALYIIDDELKDDEFSRRFMKFVILVLGAGPAIRNSILILLG
jgi:uncharacterized membrane protein